MTTFTEIDSPIGLLLATGDSAGAINGIYTPGHGRTPQPDWIRDDAAFVTLRRQLEEYFAGERTEFDLPLAPSGTPFQQAVWHELAVLPYGQTASYAELAQRIGAPRAVRAVGAANGRNPLSIVLACHRVVGSDGSLTGYAGGLAAKRWLLDHERDTLSGRPLFPIGAMRRDRL